MNPRPPASFKPFVLGAPFEAYMKKFTILSVLPFLLSACGSMIIMQNPQTKEIAQCNSSAFFAGARAHNNNQCAKAYEKAGWVRLDPDADTPVNNKP